MTTTAGGVTEAAVTEGRGASGQWLLVLLCETHIGQLSGSSALQCRGTRTLGSLSEAPITAVVATTLL